MSAGRPQVPEGIGMKSDFTQLKMELKSHKSGEFTTSDNMFDIKLKCPDPVLTTVKLLHFDASGKDTEVPNSVFTQIQDDEIVFHLALKSKGWHKLNIFAKPESAGTSGSLPCVYTYLFDLTKASKEVHDYPKQFADWKKGFYIKKPLYIDNTKDLSKVEFKVEVPSAAKRVAVKAGDEWTQLEKKGKFWEGEVCLEYYRGKGMTVDLNASMGSDPSQFSTLLRYTV